MKKGMFVRIDEKIYQKLKIYAYENDVSLQNLIEKIALDFLTHQGTNAQKSHVKDKKINIRRKDLWRNIWAVYVALLERVPVDEVFRFGAFARIVQETLGFSDTRTLKKYALILADLGAIKPLTPLIGRREKTLYRVRLRLGDFDAYSKIKSKIEEILGEKLPSILAIRNI